MNHRNLKFKFFSVIDYLEEQKWLSYQQQQGWQFVKIIAPGFYIFESCNPQNVIYQLEYQQQSITEDYIQMYQDYGWEYCGMYTSRYYFRKSEAQINHDNDTRIYTDEASKINKIIDVSKTHMMFGILSLPMSMLIGMLILFIVNFSLKTQYQAKSIFIGLITLYSIIFIFHIYLVLKLHLKIKKMKVHIQQMNSL